MRKLRRNQREVTVVVSLVSPSVPPAEILLHESSRPERDDFHVSLTQQRHALVHYEIVKLGTAARFQPIRADLDEALH
jgi:hypothetical protein